MSDLFAWVPWFRELAQKIAEGGPEYLVPRAKKIPWSADGKQAGLLNFGDENIDPFSFFYTLGSKSWPGSRKRVHPEITRQFGLESETDVDFDDGFYYPTPFTNFLYHRQRKGNPTLLWRLLRQTIDGMDAVEASDFSEALRIGNVGIHKLTQTLFLINPEEFLPWDVFAASAEPKKNDAVPDWATYRRECESARNRYPGCRPYEINLFDWLFRSAKEPLKITSRDWQIRTNYGEDDTDDWEEMLDSNLVWTRDNSLSGCADPHEPQAGDLVFVRYWRQGRGIGVVWRNLRDDAAKAVKLEVLWLNRKATAPNAALIPGPINCFTSARAGKGRELLNALRKEETYEPTFELLEQLGWKPPNGPIPPTPVFDLKSLADDILVSESELRKIADLLDDKKQVIFQGPPGTGKTYLAKKLAACLAGNDDRVRLVQFHPSYAYEDFVQGYRPTLTKDGRAGFELRDGPLLEMARTAGKEPDAKFFLVVDEINRGNLSKILGELYFLLEYRDEDIQLQYADREERFRLPPNLYIIGTMNTADRSIALVDLALRRRFHFVEFRPDKPPIEGLLGRWLDRHAQEMQWVARVVEKANEKLDDRHASIGPSYFMREGLNDAKVRMIWEHNVLPYVEERLFGQEDRLKEFDLDRLRNEAEGHPPQPENGANSDPSGAGASGNEAD